MTISWMIAMSATGLLLVCAVAIITRIARLYSGVPTRFLWLLPIAGVAVLAVLWLQPKAQPVPSFAQAPGTVAVPNSAHAIPVEFLEPLRRVGSRASELTPPSAPRQLENVALIMWALCSMVLAALLVVAGIGLRRERGQWRRITVAEHEILVAPDFGPAVVGVISPMIVLPEWALDLNDDAQRVMVLHEGEHVRMHDQRLLAVGLVAAVAMPWNPATWLSLRGLRRSIETDCDARVVARGVDRGTYASVLLDAWSRATGHFLVGAAFVEESSRLGHRVELLMRPRPRRRAMKSAIGASATAALVFMACAMPAPQKSNDVAFAPYPLIVVDGKARRDLHPNFHWVGAVVPETTTTPRFEIRFKGTSVVDTSRQAGYPRDIEAIQDIAAPAAQARFGDAARYGALLLYTKEYRARGGKMIAPGEGQISERAMPADATVNDMIDAAFNHAFRNIVLTDEQRTHARSIIAEEQAAQRAVTADSAPFMVTWPKRIALYTRKNALLRDLVTSPSDRVRLDSVFAEHVMQPIDMATITRSTLILIIQGTNMDAARQTRALDIVHSALLDEVAAYERDRSARAQRARIVAARDSSVRALLTEPERTSLDSLMARVRRRRGG